MLIIFVTMCGTDKGIPASLSHGHSSMTHHKQTTTWKATLGNSSQNATSHPLSGQKQPLTRSTRLTGYYAKPHQLHRMKPGTTDDQTYRSSAHLDPSPTSTYQKWNAGNWTRRALVAYSWGTATHQRHGASGTQ